MNDERRQAAEQYANRVRGDAFDRLRGTPPREWKEARDAYLAGQECGEQRERDAVVRWFEHEASKWIGWQTGGILDRAAKAIARGEHRGGG